MASNPRFSGEDLAACEDVLRDISGRRFALLVNSGTTALRLALEATGVGPGQDVVMPALTWQADMTAAQAVGGRPVLVDSKLDDLTIDVEAAREAINDRTGALIGVHLYATPFDQGLTGLGVPVIEDASHLLGSWLTGGVPVGSLGAVSTASFQSFKVYAGGEGGAVLTDDPVIAARVASLRNVGVVDEGMDPEEAWQGANERMANAVAERLLPQLTCARETAEDITNGILEVRRVVASITDQAELLVPDEVGQGWSLSAYYLPLRLRRRAVAETQQQFNAAVGRGSLPPYRPMHLDPTLNFHSRPFLTGLERYGLDLRPDVRASADLVASARDLLMIHHSLLRQGRLEQTLDALRQCLGE